MPLQYVIIMNSSLNKFFIMLDAGMSKNQKKFELSGFFVFTKLVMDLVSFYCIMEDFLREIKVGYPRFYGAK